MRENHYSVLEVSQDADIQQINNAYRIKAQIYHPSLNKKTGDEDTFNSIQDAYNTLSDDVLREEYDAYLDKNKPRFKRDENAPSMLELMKERSEVIKLKAIEILAVIKKILQPILYIVIFTVVPIYLGVINKPIILAIYLMFLAVLYLYIEVIQPVANVGLLYLLFLGISLGVFKYIYISILLYFGIKFIIYVLTREHREQDDYYERSGY